MGKTSAAPNEKGLKPGQTVETSTQLRPDELGYQGGMWSDLVGLGSTFSRDKPAEGAKFLREPGRASLTEPPSGYRTPSPDQPYGLNYRHDEEVYPGRSALERLTMTVERTLSRLQPQMELTFSALTDCDRLPHAVALRPQIPHRRSRLQFWKTQTVGADGNDAFRFAAPSRPEPHMGSPVRPANPRFRSFSLRDLLPPGVPLGGILRSRCPSRLRLVIVGS